MQIPRDENEAEDGRGRDGSPKSPSVGKAYGGCRKTEDDIDKESIGMCCKQEKKEEEMYRYGFRRRFPIRELVEVLNAKKQNRDGDQVILKPQVVDLVEQEREDEKKGPRFTCGSVSLPQQGHQ
jgi:hypothetical protein